MHGTTLQALKVTSQVATPGAESAVYESLFGKRLVQQKIFEQAPTEMMWTKVFIPGIIVLSNQKFGSANKLG